jgi:hypothetical protein
MTRSRTFVTFAVVALLGAGAAAQEPVAHESPPWATAPIPEPLLFDIALPLGTKKGSLEVNSIFRHPFGDGKLISVPEVEGAVLDGLSFELEIEFEGSSQVGWSVAGQPTFGRGWGRRFIHGAQLIVERNDSDRTTEIVAMYIPAVRFSPVWSLLAMIGARTPVSGDGDTRFVFNGSVFAEISRPLTLGLELNYRADISRTEKLEAIPQVHWRITNHFGIQAGFGFGRDDDSIGTEALLRVIYAF